MRDHFEDVLGYFSFFILCLHLGEAVIFALHGLRCAGCRSPGALGLGSRRLAPTVRHFGQGGAPDSNLRSLPYYSCTSQVFALLGIFETLLFYSSVLFGARSGAILTRRSVSTWRTRTQVRHAMCLVQNRPCVLAQPK